MNFMYILLLIKVIMWLKYLHFRMYCNHYNCRIITHVNIKYLEPLMYNYIQDSTLWQYIFKHLLSPQSNAHRVTMWQAACSTVRTGHYWVLPSLFVQRVIHVVQFCIRSFFLYIAPYIPSLFCKFQVRFIYLFSGYLFPFLQEFCFLVKYIYIYIYVCVCVCVIAASFMFLLCGFLPLNLICVHLCVRWLFLHILLNHVAAVVLSYYTCYSSNCKPT